MNIIKREWLSNRKACIYWSIGLALLILVAFYKVSGMNSTPGGVEGMLASLPKVLQVFLGAGKLDYSTAVGNYSMIHLYLVIALALHAVSLGAAIFSKEERDKTYEFLYVKGVKRNRILSLKVLAGIAILITLDIVCFLAILGSVVLMGLSFVFMDILPYLVSLFICQVFFFVLALTLSLLLRNSQKAGMFGTCIVLVMFLISMYVKLGGNIELLDTLSLFHYTDAAFIQANPYGGMSSLIILAISLIGLSVSICLHDRRDLL